MCALLRIVDAHVERWRGAFERLALLRYHKPGCKGPIIITKPNGAVMCEGCGVVYT